MIKEDKTLAGMKRILRELGFSNYESDVLSYLSIVRTPMKASEISSVTGIPRTKIYSALYSLAEADLVTIDPGRPMRFSAPPPELLSSLLFDKVIEEASRKVSILKKISYLEISEGLWLIGEVVLPINGYLLGKIVPILINSSREFLVLILPSKNKEVLPKKFPNVKVSLLVDDHESYEGIEIPGPKDVRFGNPRIFAIVSEKAALLSDVDLEKGLYVSERKMLRVVTEMVKSLYTSGLPES